MVDSPRDLALAALPALALLLLGATSPRWPQAWRAVPAALGSAGAALGVLLLLIALALTGPDLLEPAAVVALPLAGYLAALGWFARRPDIDARRVALAGVLALLPGVALFEWTLMTAVCGIRSAGC